MTDSIEIPTAELTALHHRIGLLEGAASMAAHILANAHAYTHDELLEAAKSLERIVIPAQTVEGTPQDEAVAAVLRAAEAAAAAAGAAGAGGAMQPITNRKATDDERADGRTAMLALLIEWDDDAPGSYHPPELITDATPLLSAEGLKILTELIDEKLVEKRNVEGSRWKQEARITTAGREQTTREPDA